MNDNEHYEIWINGKKENPITEEETNNAIACLNKLHELGNISTDNYVRSLVEYAIS